MAERMTSVRLRTENPANGHGLAHYGRESRSAMIQEFREYSQRQFDQAKRVLEADDDDFIVETYVGVNVERQKEEVRD